MATKRTILELKQWLAEQVAAAAGIPLEEVDMEAAFLDLGLDSVGHFTIAGDLAEWLNQSIPSNLLFEHKTILEVTGAVMSQEDSGMECLVTMQEGDAGEVPIYLVHSVAGDLLDWEEFSGQLGGRPVYGVQQPYESDGAKDGSSLESLVTSYVGPMLRHRPEGPFCIAGHSAGARLAFELARQLTQSGRQVPFLAILDGWPRLRRRASLLEGVRATPAFLANLPRWIRDDLLENGVESVRERLKRKVRAHVRNSKQHSKEGQEGAVPQVELEDYFNVEGLSERVLQRKRANLLNWSSYIPEPTPLRVTLFRAKTRPLYHSLLDPTAGWPKYATLGVDVQVVPGHHTNMNRAPFASGLAAQLNKILDRNVKRLRSTETVPV
jgi:thioesterase domain-containing protein/acyl carrier protein